MCGAQTQRPPKGTEPCQPFATSRAGARLAAAGGELQFVKLLAMPHFTAQFPSPPPAPPPGLKLAFLCTRTHAALKDRRLRD